MSLICSLQKEPLWRKGFYSSGTDECRGRQQKWDSSQSGHRFPLSPEQQLSLFFPVPANMLNMTSESWIVLQSRIYANHYHPDSPPCPSVRRGEERCPSHALGPPGCVWLLLRLSLGSSACKRTSIIWFQCRAGHGFKGTIQNSEKLLRKALTQIYSWVTQCNRPSTSEKGFQEGRKKP